MLPDAVRTLFWDQDATRIAWKTDADAITARVLGSGDWEAIRWLRCMRDDENLRAWILSRSGRGLDPRRLRYWQIVLDLPGIEVDRWIKAPERQPWQQRVPL